MTHSVSKEAEEKMRKIAEFIQLKKKLVTKKRVKFAVPLELNKGNHYARLDINEDSRGEYFVISIILYLFEHYSLTQLKNTVLHELAHVSYFESKTKKQQPHGKEFRANCKKLGACGDVSKAYMNPSGKYMIDYKKKKEYSEGLKARL